MYCMCHLFRKSWELSIYLYSLVRDYTVARVTFKTGTAFVYKRDILQVTDILARCSHLDIFEHHL